MPPPNTSGYNKQILSKRYIKAAVLRAFIEAKIDEFGEAWTWEVFFPSESHICRYTSRIF
jgi:hypothetical protein